MSIDLLTAMLCPWKKTTLVHHVNLEGAKTLIRGTRNSLILLWARAMMQILGRSVGCLGEGRHQTLGKLNGILRVEITGASSL